MTPRIVIRYFGRDEWKRVARVLAFTARQQCPTWTVDIAVVSPKPVSSPLGSTSNVVNTQKLDFWADAVSAALDGERLLLLDADTAILRPLDDVWDTPFDVAYTTKHSGARLPFNAGVMFLRATPQVKAFIEAWRTENRRMLDDYQHHQMWKPAFGGINQSALGCLFKHHAHDGLQVRRLPCVEWNCEDESWPKFDPATTRIVHFKGDLFRAICGKQRPTSVTAPLVRVWRTLEVTAELQTARSA